MSYQIGLIGTLKECLLPIIIFTCVLCGIVLKMQKNKVERPYKIVFAIICATFLPLMLLPFLVAPSSTTGWILKDNILQVSSNTASDTIDLSSSRISLLKVSQPWLPIYQGGVHYTFVTTGRMQLQNGKIAWVFMHNTSPSLPVLVLFSNNKYYVLSHPGIDDLYHKLKQRGVEEFTP